MVFVFVPNKSVSKELSVQLGIGIIKYAYNAHKEPFLMMMEIALQ